MGATSKQMFNFLAIDNTVVWKNCAKNSTFDACFHIWSANKGTKWHLLPARNRRFGSGEGPLVSFLWCFHIGKHSQQTNPILISYIQTTTQSFSTSVKNLPFVKNRFQFCCLQRKFCCIACCNYSLTSPSLNADFH